MRFFIYAFKGNRLFTGYRTGRMAGALLFGLQAEGWKVHYREAA